MLTVCEKPWIISALKLKIIGASLSEPHTSRVNVCSVGIIIIIITSAMQGICGASLSNVAVMPWNSNGDDVNISKQPKVQASPEVKGMKKAFSALACHLLLAVTIPGVICIAGTSLRILSCLIRYPVFSSYM